MKLADIPADSLTLPIHRMWKDDWFLLTAGDWEAKVIVNGKTLGTHQGGYDAFSYDITDALNPSGKQEMVLTAWDPTNEGGQPVGKQILNPSGCSYTPSAWDLPNGSYGFKLSFEF